MNILEFFNFRTTCPICLKELQNGAEVDFGFSDNEKDNFSMPGGVIYTYDGKRFNKSKIVHFENEMESLVINNEPISIIDIIDIFISKTFTINKKIFPRFNIANITKNIPNKYSLFPIDYRLISFCDMSNAHSYYYQSSQIFENEYVVDSNLSLFSEWVNIFDIRINNIFETKEETWAYDEEGSRIILPYIKIDKWSFSSKDRLKDQITKYKLLT